MIIKPEILIHWKALYAHGDYMKIADDYCTVNQRIDQKTARVLVSDAFRFGTVRENLFPVIEAYYKKIEKSLKVK